MEEQIMPRWFIWTLAAIVSWGFWAVLSKILGNDLDSAQIQIYSTAGMVPVIGLLVASKKVRTGQHSKSGAFLAFAAGLLGCFGNVSYYGILSGNAKAATIVPLTALYPLVTIFLALIFLREKLNAVQTAGVALSLGAIYFFNVQHEGGFWSPWLLAALVPVVLWGLAGFAQKLATFRISGELATLYFLFAFLAFVPVVRYVLPHIGPGYLTGLTEKTLTLAVLLGFALALGNFACLLAFAHGGKASIITPITALYPIVSIPIAIFGFGERTSLRESVAIILALVAVVAISIETKAAIPESSTP
jgi:transporter family protein